MGFGLLFIGYFFMLFVPLGELALMPNLSFIGCVIMFFALNRLITYCEGYSAFVKARILLFPLFGLTLASFLCGIIAPNIPVLSQILWLAVSVTLAVYSLLLFLGIFKLAADVELPKLSARARGLISLSVVYAIFSLVSGICQAVFANMDATGLSVTVKGLLHYTDFAAYLLENAFLLFALALLFSCYARICLEGDADMAPKNKSKGKK